MRKMYDLNSQHPILNFFEIFQEDMKEKEKLTWAQIKNY